ncbi:MAG TPA: LptF/LptG family permease [Puia sp.]|nr:LptF/LptG family permease [Puia sp.]
MSNRFVKRLDVLIIKAFIGPFIATFFIVVFVLVLQFMWLYIDDVVGKGLDMLTVARLIMYVAATMVPLALPLAVLLSSIMTLGNLGETFELVAIKSAGISLLRFLRPLLVVTILITGIAFFFNNDILPVANLKMNTLKYDIIVSKPAFDIKEGVFYDRIEGYVIKVGKKEKDDSTIRAVVIYEQNTNGAQDNMIVADRGKMVVTPDKRSLLFVLQDGWIYQEKPERNGPGSEFVRMGFKNYKKVLDLSSFKMNKTDDSAFKNNYQMLTMFQLSRNIDSLEKANDERRKRAVSDMRTMLKFTQMLDTSAWVTIQQQPAATFDTSHYLRRDAVVRDSLVKSWAADRASKDSVVRKKALAMKSAPAPVFSDLLPDSTRNAVLDRSIAMVSSAKINLDQPALLYENEENNLRQHEIAWHEKITLAVACIVMFLIGAPLGSIIRKGGIGMPLIFAVVFFVIFFLLNNFGKKFVKEDVLTPIGGMWMATYVLTPIGLFLVYKALHDSTLFNKESWFRLASRIRALFQRKKAEELF